MMMTHVLFLHGGGGVEDFEADALLVDSLREKLGEGYVVHYPLLPEESSPDLGRQKQIQKAISSIDGEIILVAHSFGASMLLKYLSETRVEKKIAGIFLLATPYWSGDEDWNQAFKLQEDFADKLPKGVPIFLYHSKDDEEVPLRHLSFYKKKLPQATVREMPNGGHQFNNNLTMVAKDIKLL